jgi:hypothetical protein
MKAKVELSNGRQFRPSVLQLCASGLLELVPQLVTAEEPVGYSPESVDAGQSDRSTEACDIVRKTEFGQDHAEQSYP